jgi:hypothetical protein
MESVLIAGCSFAGIAAGYSHPAPKVNLDQFQFFGDAAAGNRAIAARVRHQISRAKYKHVVVMWSGINRIDIPIERTTHEKLPDIYPYVTVLEDWAWYLSGGMGSSWQSDDHCPNLVKSQFREQYLHQTPRSATDSSLAAILETQELLNSRNINYTMCFIYDIYRSYDEVVDKVTNTYRRTIGTDRWPRWLALEHCLGKIDITSSLYSMVDWGKFTIPVTPYEYCAERDLLQIDQFHPTSFGMAEWFDTQVGFNITS